MGEGFVRGVLYDLGGYPGAVADREGERQDHRNGDGAAGRRGHCLQQLDEYEGFDPRAPETSEYIRERQIVELKTGGTVECWFYRYNREAARLAATSQSGRVGEIKQLIQRSS